MPKLPGPGETVIGGTFSRAHGGKGANQATAARLGARTFIVGAVGDDFGRDARQVLMLDGVDISRLLVSQHPTGVAQIIVDEGGENIIAVASGANGESKPGQIAALLYGLLEPGAVVLCNLEIPLDVVMAAGHAARENHCLFILNPAPARPLPPELLRLCDVLTPNEHEVANLGVHSVGSLLAQGAGAVVVTRGAHGADLVLPGRTSLHQHAFPIDVVDTTGAGDAFTATLGWALAEGRSLEVALPLAAAGGALATRGLGARPAMATREEVLGLASGKGGINAEDVT